MNKWLKLIIKLVFSSLIIFLLLKYNKIDFSKVKSALQDKQLVLVLFSLVGVALVLNSYRWMKILNIQKVPAKLGPCYRYSVIGVFFSFIVPSSVGGDLVKAILAAAKWSESKAKLLFSTLIDRVIGLFVMMNVCLFAYLFNFKFLNEVDEIRESVLIVAACGLGLVVLLYLVNYLLKNKVAQKISNRLDPMTSFFKGLTNHKFDLFTCLLMSLGSTFCHIIFYYSVFVFFDIPIPMSVLMFCVPIGTLLTALPIAPAGVGVGQAVFYYMFNIFDQSLGEIAFLAVTLLQIIYFSWAIIGALLFSVTPAKIKNEGEV